MGGRLLVTTACLSWWLFLCGAQMQFVKWRPMDVVARLMVAKIDPVDAFRALEAVRNLSVPRAINVVNQLPLDIENLYYVLSDMRIDPLDALLALRLWVREHSNEVYESDDSKSDESIIILAKEIKSMLNKIVKAFKADPYGELVNEAFALASLINDPKKLFQDFFGYDELFRSFKQIHPAAFEAVKNILFGQKTSAPAQQALPQQQSQSLPQPQSPPQSQLPPQPQSPPQPQPQPQAQIPLQPQPQPQSPPQPQQQQQQQQHQPQSPPQPQPQPQPQSPTQPQSQPQPQPQTQSPPQPQPQSPLQSQPQPQVHPLPSTIPQPSNDQILKSIQQIHSQLHASDVDLQDPQFADVNRYRCVFDETQVYNKGPNDPPEKARRTIHNIRRYFDKVNQTVVESLKTVEYHDSGLKSVRKSVRTVGNIPSKKK